MERRSYQEFCGVAKALDLIGERWTLLIVRNLLLGPVRYGDLQRGLPGITTNLLAKRLREMEEGGLVARVREGGATAYRLTVDGAALEPALHALGRWGWRRMTAPAAGEHRSIEWFLVALRRRYLGGATLRAELVAYDTAYRIVLSPVHAEIERGSLSHPDLRLLGSALDLTRLFLDIPARETILERVALEGTQSSLATLLGAFATSDWPDGLPGRPAVASAPSGR